MLRTLYRKYDAPLPAWLDDDRPEPPGARELIVRCMRAWGCRVARLVCPAWS